MKTFQYVVLSRAVPGREDAFERWYDEQHLADLLAVPGIVKASRYRVLRQLAAADAPTIASIAVYEIAADDPQPVLDEVLTRAGAGVMAISDALDVDAVIQLIAEPSSAAAAAQPPSC